MLRVLRSDDDDGDKPEGGERGEGGEDGGFALASLLDSEAKSAQLLSTFSVTYR